MKKFHWLKRRRPASYLISEYGSQSKLEDRYLQDSGIRFVSPPPTELKELYKPIKERVEVRIDCQVSVGGVSCGVEVGELGSEVSGNEPTEPLKNIKKTIHARFVPSAPLLYHDPKYGGWDNPYKFVNKLRKKEKKFEYY